VVRVSVSLKVIFCGAHYFHWGWTIHIHGAIRICIDGVLDALDALGANVKYNGTSKFHHYSHRMGELYRFQDRVIF
jgi:hypothetical protein